MNPARRFRQHPIFDTFVLIFLSQVCNKTCRKIQNTGKEKSEDKNWTKIIK